MTQATEQLKKRLSTIGNIQRAAALLEWDMQTYMPQGGAAARAEQLATLSEISHDMFASQETVRLLEQAEQSASSLDPSSEEARLVQRARRDYDHTARIPTELQSDIARHSALAQDVWQRARAANDFPTFAPYLEKSFDLARQVADNLGYTTEPYDALLDMFEEDAKAAEIAIMFADLKPHLVELTKAIVKSPRKGQDAPIPGPFPIEAQNAVTKKIVASLGYDFNRGSQDQAPHPFCSGFSRNDVRITTRFNRDYLNMALYASLHEAGHAMYEQGLPEEYDNTPLGHAASMGAHESQSRLWENLVGRSRQFAEYVLPTLKEAFPSQMGNVTPDQFYRSANCVQPSFIRVEADEVTYNLHVLLRFELERDVLSGNLKVADLPEAWNAKMQEYLGVTPAAHSEGVMQDVHWAAGLIGYFPTYSLGNLLSAQLWNSIRKVNPDLDEQLRRGEFAPLLGWLREKIHSRARLLKPDALIREATGESLNAKYYVDYLKFKYTALYEL
jgi:carboxypeptidase Taq